MKITDPWISVLKNNIPGYESLVQTMSSGPTIKLTIVESGRKAVLSLQEVWPDEVTYTYFNSSGLDERVDWCKKELQKWKNVRRTAWDMWEFKSLRDAEKFVTIYHLVWDR